MRRHHRMLRQQPQGCLRRRQQPQGCLRLEENGKTVTGRGADTDTMVASARAYVSALNKLIIKRQKTAPDSESAWSSVKGVSDA